MGALIPDKGLKTIQKGFQLLGKGFRLPYDGFQQGSLLPLYFLIGGQSNASGRGLVIGGETSSQKVKVFGNDYILREASQPIDDWTNQIDSVSSDDLQPLSAMHDFSLTAAKNIVNVKDSRITLIPCAKGSTSFSDWMPAVDSIDRSTLFGSAKYRQQTVAMNGLTACWHYGHETSALEFTDYNMIFSTWMTRVRREWDNFPFVFAQLAKHSVPATNAAQNNAAELQRQLETGYSANPLIVGNPVVDYDFTEVGWTSGLPDGWSLTGTESATNYITQDARGMKLVSDGGLIGVKLITAALIVSNVYVLELELIEVTQGLIKVVTGGTVTLGGAVIKRFIITATSVNTYIYRNAGNTNAIIRSIKIYPYTSGNIYEPIDTNYMVCTFDLPLIDAIHLDQAGQIELGRRFALATRQHVLGESVNGTGPRLTASAFTHPSADKSKVKITFDKAINDGSATDYNGQFRVYDDAVEMTVSSAVRDVDGVSVLITMSAIAIGIVTVSYGDVAATGTGVWLTDVVQDSDSLPAPQFSAQEVI